MDYFFRIKRKKAKTSKNLSEGIVPPPPLPGFRVFSWDRTNNYSCTKNALTKENNVITITVQELSVSLWNVSFTLETQSSEEELKKILGSVHSDQPLVSYNHSGKINFSQIENAGISSNENYQFQGEPFRLNSIITFVIDFEKELIFVYKNANLQTVSPELKGLSKLEGLIYLFRNPERGHLKRNLLSSFFPVIPIIPTKDPRVRARTLFLNRRIYFEKLLKQNKPSKDGTITSEQRFINFSTKRCNNWSDEAWNRVVATITQNNVPVEIKIPTHKPIDAVLIAKRLLSIINFIWCFLIFSFPYSEGEPFMLFQIMMEMNPTCFKDIYVMFKRKAKKEEVNLIASSGAILPFRLRGVGSILLETNVSFGSDSYFLLDLIIHQLFNKTKAWINDHCWETTRLFFIAIKKENKHSCPAASLPLDILMYILEYTGLRNIYSCSTHIESSTLDVIFKKNLPFSIYKEIEQFQTYQSIETQLQRIPEESIQFYQVQGHFNQNIRFNSVNYISKRIADFSVGSVIYFSTFLEVIIKRISSNSRKPPSIRTIRSHNVFLSAFCDEELSKFIGTLDFNLDWKWLLEDNTPLDEIPLTIVNAKPSSLTEDQVSILESENNLRKLFVEQRQSKELSNPYIGLIDVYENSFSFQYSELNEKEKLIPMILCPKKEKFIIGNSSITSYELFLTNLEQLTLGALQGMDWNNVFLAGGAVLSALSPNNQEGFEGSDLDLFIYGEFEEDANDKVEYIISLIEKNFFSSPNLPLIIQTKNAITVVRGFPHRNIQIVLRLYNSPAEVLLGFDVDACSVGFDGKRIWVTERAQRAINKRYNLVNPTRRSSSYEYRLWKYSKRGFGVCIPNLDGSKINYSKLLSCTTNQLEGLAKLLLYECGKIHFQFFKDPVKTKKDLERDIYDKGSLDINFIHSKIDYTHVSIPYGPKWDLTRILEFLNDRNWGVARNKDPNKYYIRTFVGAQSFRSEKAKEKIIWLVKNPGQQEFEGTPDSNLLRGSFYPLPSVDWEKDIY